MSILTKSLKNADGMTKDILCKLIDNYIRNYNENEEINSILFKKKIRHENFPSHISENICKFAIHKKYNIMPCWDTSVGDLEMVLDGITKKIEVKGFMSNGPSSFGPTEAWDSIYFIDCKNFKNKQFKVFEILLSNTSDIWGNVKINSVETFRQIADANQRGKLRGCFYNIFKPQLGDYCNIIFDGHVNDL